jgi:hypothetical protein
MNMKDPKDMSIWNKKKGDIVDEILAIPGKHNAENGEPIFLAKTDVIVWKTSLHHGRKDKNPLSRVRFVEREAYFGDLPEAVEVSEDDYPTSIPREFQKNVVLVFCRDPDPAKLDLLKHVFNAWKLQGSEYATPAYDVDDLQHDEFDAGEEHGNDGLGGSRMLTQEDPEDNDFTPQKQSVRNYCTDPSPIPLNLRR